MSISKEEAIRILFRYDTEYYTPNTREAHRMAIEALQERECMTMDVRKKLVELIEQSLCDHLTFSCKLAENIANGVTFVTDNNVGCGWIPVTERFPEEGGYYLVCHQSKHVSMRLYYAGCDELFVDVRHDPITHWMPLPEPPKEVD